jgi:hypothetical protein
VSSVYESSMEVENETRVEGIDGGEIANDLKSCDLDDHHWGVKLLFGHRQPPTVSFHFGDQARAKAAVIHQANTHFEYSIDWEPGVVCLALRLRFSCYLQSSTASDEKDWKLERSSDVDLTASLHIRAPFSAF